MRHQDFGDIIFDPNLTRRKMKILIFLPDERSTWERVSSSTDLWFLRFQISQEKMLNQILPKNVRKYIPNKSYFNELIKSYLYFSALKTLHIRSTRNTATYKQSKTHVRWKFFTISVEIYE